MSYKGYYDDWEPNTTQLTEDWPSSTTQLTEDTFYSDREATLNLEQIVYLIWSITCIMPNLLLILVFVKYNFYRTNFYFIIGNWSVANVIQIICAMVLALIDFPYRFVEIFETIYWILSIVPVIFALLLIFDFFVDSKKRCLYTVYNIWVSTVINAGVIVVAKMWGFKRFLTPTDVIIIGNLSLAVLGIRTVVYCVKSSQDKRYPLRLTLTTLCIFSNFTISLYLACTIFATVFVEAILQNIVVYVVATNGFINLLLLVSFDQDIKSKFCQLFGCKQKQFNVKFSVRQSVELNDHASLGDEGNNTNNV